MKHRIVYNSDRVIAAFQDSSNTVTASAENFIIEELAKGVQLLSSLGINFSHLWKNGFIDRINPYQEFAISDHPENAMVKRKVFVHSMPISQQDKLFWTNFIIRHFSATGDHLTAPYDDEMFSIVTDNSTQVEGVGEYDYYANLMNSGASIFQLQQAQIPVMDGLGRFGIQIYS